MTTAISIDLSKKELFYGRELAKGNMEFDDLEFHEKLAMYESGVSLQPVVPKETIEDFEHTLAMKGYFGTGKMVKAAVREGRSKLPV